MITLAIIPIAAICNVMRGRGWKLQSGIALAGLYTLLYWIATKQLSLYTFTAFPIILMGWYLANCIGTGRQFNAIHGREMPKLAGTLYGSLRGLARFSFSIPLAILYHNWWIAPLGLIGIISGPIYYLVGKVYGEKKSTVAICEIIDGALGYGLIFVLIYWMSR